MDENPLIRGSSQPQLKNLEGWRCHPLLKFPVLRVETGRAMPGSTGMQLSISTRSQTTHMEDILCVCNCPALSTIDGRGFKETNVVLSFQKTSISQSISGRMASPPGASSPSSNFAKFLPTSQG